jgi:hypothetical protein
MIHVLRLVTKEGEYRDSLEIHLVTTALLQVPANKVSIAPKELTSLTFFGLDGMWDS